MKLADVTPVFKSGDKINVKNYKPISVLPIVSKLLERIMQNQIISHIENYLSQIFVDTGKATVSNMI